MTKVFFVDFDDVLFNTRDFMADLIAACAPFGIGEGEWREAYRARTGDIPGVHKPFTIERFAEVLGNRTGVPAAQLADAMRARAMDDLPRYVFADSVPFLRAVGRNHAMVLTYGDTEFQMTRVRDSGIAREVADVFVTQSQKVEVIADYLAAYPDVAPADIVYLDDRATYFGPVKERLPDVHTVLVARPERRYADAPTDACDTVVESLEEVRSLFVFVNTNESDIIKK